MYAAVPPPEPTAMRVVSHEPLMAYNVPPARPIAQSRQHAAASLDFVRGLIGQKSKRDRKLQFFGKHLQISDGGIYGCWCSKFYFFAKFSQNVF